MDHLSHFLALHPVRTTLDWRCELKAPWRLVNEGTVLGTVPFHLVVKGTVWLETAGINGLQLKAGDILMLPHGTPHTLHCGDKHAPLPQVLPARVTAVGTLKNHGAPETEVLCGEFMFDPIISNFLLQSLPEVALLSTQATSEHWHLYQLLQLLNEETRLEKPGSHAITQHLSSALFSLLIRGWITQSNLPGSLLNVFNEPRLYPALEVLFATSEKTLALEKLAHLCHMSRATFIRVFRQTSGYSPAQLMTAIRMTQAAKLLTKPGTSINVISGLVGYASEPAFHRAFRKHTGMSPGEFRRKN